MFAVGLNYSRRYLSRMWDFLSPMFSPQIFYQILVWIFPQFFFYTHEFQRIDHWLIRRTISINICKKYTKYPLSIPCVCKNLVTLFIIHNCRYHSSLYSHNKSLRITSEIYYASAIGKKIQRKFVTKKRHTKSGSHANALNTWMLLMFAMARMLAQPTTSSVLYCCCAGSSHKTYSKGI